MMLECRRVGIAHRMRRIENLLERFSRDGEG
jgi:hypothetical protein